MRGPSKLTKPVHAGPNRAVLQDQLAAIPILPRAALVAQWRAAYGCPPPKGLSRRLLEHAAAYHPQSKAFGVLKPSIRRKLHRLARSAQNGKVRPKPSKPPSTGTRLVRQWHGRTHMVEVLEDGFLWDGQYHRSLSAVARAITGARWSGPRFFGL